MTNELYWQREKIPDHHLPIPPPSPFTCFRFNVHIENYHFQALCLIGIMLFILLGNLIFMCTGPCTCIYIHTHNLLLMYIWILYVTFTVIQLGYFNNFYHDGVTNIVVKI